jgi:hypothetical protein
MRNCALRGSHVISISFYRLAEGRVIDMWEEKSVPMVRVASGDLVYNSSGAYDNFARVNSETDGRAWFHFRFVFLGHVPEDGADSSGTQ